QQAKVVEAELEALRDENASLTSTKEKLEDPDYVQTYARGEYMFSKGDEKVFYLPGD
ncbi:MAG: septum formation initiator family protein, partial [Erysipelotrichaceae bacterium]|nr:septum formation initiator family protein [Erysipelotrichaceae bacterium]